MSPVTELSSGPSSISSSDRRENSDVATREKAAGTIQRTFRGHRTRRELQGLALDASTRWTELIKDAQYRNLTAPTAPSDNIGSEHTEPADSVEDQQSSPGARKHWQRISTIARRAGADDVSPTRSASSLDDQTSSSQEDGHQASFDERQRGRQKHVESHNARRKTAKMMDLQYFLEMVDQKHRYGSSLRKYHNYWKSQPTTQNFFYWLDHGDGKHVEMPECDRGRLEREQVRYLSREERLHYLVTVDREGRLRWAKNGEKVWTKDTMFKDSMKGIVPIDDQGTKFHYNIRPEGTDLDSSSMSNEEDESDEADADKRYLNEEFHEAKGLKKLKEVSPAVIFNHLIRGHMKKGHKWIFVADTSFRLYVGIKQSGAFQHSSFLHGARISAAGLIKIKDGQLRSLAPLRYPPTPVSNKHLTCPCLPVALQPRSGHYRPPAANFRSFVHCLHDEGVDMSRVSISKSYAVLIGMESYTRSKQKVKDVESSLGREKNKILHPEKVRQQDEQQMDKSKSAEKERQHLENLRLEEKEKNKRDYGTTTHQGFGSKLIRKVGLGGKEKDSDADERMSQGRGIPGEGPEDGVPAPEGIR